MARGCLMGQPVARGRRGLRASGQVSAGDPVAIDRGMLGRQRGLQRPDGAGGGTDMAAHRATWAAAASRTGTCGASDAPMLAKTWARGEEGPRRRSSIVVGAPCLIGRAH